MKRFQTITPRVSSLMKGARIEAGLSLKDAAACLGIPNERDTTLWQYENSIPFSLDCIIPACKAYKLDFWKKVFPALLKDYEQSLEIHFKASIGSKKK